jgi:hypothetical protein
MGHYLSRENEIRNLFSYKTVQYLELYLDKEHISDSLYHKQQAEANPDRHRPWGGSLVSAVAALDLQTASTEAESQQSLLHLPSNTHRLASPLTAYARHFIRCIAAEKDVNRI